MEESLQEQHTEVGAAKLKQQTFKSDGVTKPDEIFTKIAQSKAQRMAVKN
jgi:hypothetical protein